MTKFIPLTRGYQAIVDAEDYEELARHNWQAIVCNNTVYAMRREGGGLRICHYMHRDILDAPSELMVDHVDRNGLNNSRSNLRVATRRQNFCNRASKRGSASRYLGVSRNRDKWVARIRVDGAQRSLGRFENEVEAALAYDCAARDLHGEFARPNFPEVAP